MGDEKRGTAELSAPNSAVPLFPSPGALSFATYNEINHLVQHIAVGGGWKMVERLACFVSVSIGILQCAFSVPACQHPIDNLLNLLLIVVCLIQQFLDQFMMAILRMLLQRVDQW